ncbi:MAG TPA: hypothetical protein VK117_13905, partial [Pyrinomonadaceae bacterium]|nr:hypothetical protein [Pyrinomonadaceae bacterium]
FGDSAKSLVEVAAGATASPDQQHENSFCAIQSPFSFAVRLAELFNLDRIFCLLSHDEIHRALSLFIRHRRVMPFAADDISD